MPSDVSITTPISANISGPKKDVYTPLNSVPPAVVTLCCESFAIVSVRPPFTCITATITATMPASITIPCIKSFIAVAI